MHVQNRHMIIICHLVGTTQPFSWSPVYCDHDAKNYIFAVGKITKADMATYMMILYSLGEL